jgi:hypothetical protein
MAKGFQAITAIAEEKKTRGTGGSFSNKRFFSLGDGETGVIRILEQGDEVIAVWRHQLESASGQFAGYETCLDQDPDTGERVGRDCPGCEEGLKRKFRGAFNVIWRESPVLQKDDDGKLVKDNRGNLVVEGFEDQIALWETSGEVLEDLQILDADYNGLSSRDFKVRRRGVMFDTKYYITPADPDGGAQKLTKVDQELVEQKYDLDEVTAAPSYEQWGKRGQPDNKKSVTGVSADVSPFKKRIRQD